MPLPLMHDSKGNPDDPRIPTYAALRKEWINHQRITPRLLELEATAAAQTQALIDGL